MATITKEEYGILLGGYIREQMSLLPEGKKNLKFWFNFNKQKKEEFDAQLETEGTTVEA